MGKEKQKYKLKKGLIILVAFLVTVIALGLIFLVSNSNRPAWIYDTEEHESFIVDGLECYYPQDWPNIDGVTGKFSGTKVGRSNSVNSAYVEYLVLSYDKGLNNKSAIKKYLNTEEKLSIETVDGARFDKAVRCRYEEGELKHYIYAVKCEGYGFIMDFSAKGKRYYLESEFDKMFNDVDFYSFKKKKIEEKRLENDPNLKKAAELGQKVGNKINEKIKKWNDFLTKHSGE